MRSRILESLALTSLVRCSWYLTKLFNMPIRGLTRRVFFLVHIANYLCTYTCIFNYLYFYKYVYTYSRAYSRRLLGATIAPNLLPWVLKQIFLLEMVKNGICFGSVSKQNALCTKKCAPINATMPLLSRIGNVFVNKYR